MSPGGSWTTARSRRPAVSSPPSTRAVTPGPLTMVVSGPGGLLRALRPALGPRRGRRDTTGRVRGDGLTVRVSLRRTGLADAGSAPGARLEPMDQKGQQAGAC